MENYLTIVFCITGIVLFLYGIICLSKKFEAIVKEKITFYLRNITKNPVKGTLFGFLITALNQSSSATTVLTIA
ncbi:MAG: Na/Pi cotransporter family protein, partial [Candidatus Pacearchaeota archaeon]|nr:Na/Pi cotransporter family protein [Candidatus Pacearchaeota archaeon]